MRSAQCLAQVSTLKPPHLGATEEEEQRRRVQAALRPRRSKNGVEDYGGEMTADSFPPIRGSNSNHLRTPEALRIPSAGILLPPLLRLDFLNCGALAPPPLLEALTRPRIVCDSPDFHLDAQPITLTAPAALLSARTLM